MQVSVCAEEPSGDSLTVWPYRQVYFARECHLQQRLKGFAKERYRA